MAGKNFRILSVDGGGLRGLVPALLLRDLETRLEAKTGDRRPLSDYFHLFAGTSTGGLISLGLTAPDPKDPERPSMNAEKLVALYRKRGAAIFPPRFRLLRMLRGMVVPKFSNEGLRMAVNEEIGDPPLSSALRDVVITAYDMTAHEPRYLKRWKARDDDLLNPTMADAAMATASAPTYLPPWRMTTAKRMDGNAFVDGGVFAANPTMAAITEALDRKSDPPAPLDLEDLFVVSLGTGYFRVGYSPRRLRSWGALAWVSPRGSEPALMRAMLDGQTVSTDHFAEVLLNDDPQRRRYYRIESELATDVEMDDAREKTLRRLAGRAEELIEERGDDLQAIADRLAAAGPI
jgi:uncharacterized protein